MDYRTFEVALHLSGKRVNRDLGDGSTRRLPNFVTWHAVVRVCDSNGLNFSTIVDLFTFISDQTGRAPGM